MAKRHHDWTKGAKLSEHSRCKLEILREYIFDYMTVRCKRPQQERFRLAIVDGFAGGGRYECGTSGSPIIFMEELKHAVETVNLQRSIKGLSGIEVHCLLILNDFSRNAVELLKENIAPIQAEIAETCPKLYLEAIFLNEKFEAVYPKVKEILIRGRFRNVLFNLDQYGYTQIEQDTILDIMEYFPSAEIFYTFVFSSLLAFLEKNQPDRLRKKLRKLGLSNAELQRLADDMSRKEWLGVAEQLVFDAFQFHAPYVSPFSINNPKGWSYWLIHFAKSYRARQVYNNILHKKDNSQAHYGRLGLDMLSYDPRKEGMLYLFQEDDRESAMNQLLEDIPRLVMESGDAMSMVEFYENTYNATAAHADDIHKAIIQNEDLEVITKKGGVRKKPDRIKPDDIVKVNMQRNFFPLLLPDWDKEKE